MDSVSIPLNCDCDVFVCVECANKGLNNPGPVYTDSVVPCYECGEFECVCAAESVGVEDDDSLELPLIGMLICSCGKTKDECIFRDDGTGHCEKCFLSHEECDGSCICRHCGKGLCEEICRCPKCHEETGCDCDLSEFSIPAFTGAPMKICDNCGTHANPSNFLGCDGISCLSYNLEYDDSHVLIHLCPNEFGNCNKCGKTPEKCKGFCECACCGDHECKGDVQCGHCGVSHCPFDDCDKYIPKLYECEYCANLLAHPDDSCWCFHSAKYGGGRFEG